MPSSVSTVSWGTPTSATYSTDESGNVTVSITYNNVTYADIPKDIADAFVTYFQLSNL